MSINHSPYYAPRPQPVLDTEPFESTEQAWFWFMLNNDARMDGARPLAGEALIPRPCEPGDILQVIGRLHRQRRLLPEHIKIMAHYGRRLMPPDPYRPLEARASSIWKEAMDTIDSPLRGKGIVQ